MSMHDDEDKVPREGEAPGRPAYEPPDIAWEEPWQPIAVGLSCAKQAGNPGCSGGPFGS